DVHAEPDMATRPASVGRDARVFDGQEPGVVRDEERAPPRTELALDPLVLLTEQALHCDHSWAARETVCTARTDARSTAPILATWRAGLPESTGVVAHDDPRTPMAALVRHRSHRARGLILPGPGIFRYAGWDGPGVPTSSSHSGHETRSESSRARIDRRYRGPLSSHPGPPRGRCDPLPGFLLRI